jgi:CRP/FNR family transcriptional regulator
MLTSKQQFSNGYAFDNHAERFAHGAMDTATCRPRASIRTQLGICRADGPFGLSIFTQPCSSCTACFTCERCVLSALEYGRLNAISRGLRLVKRGETLYRTGTRFENIYAVQSGSFKTVIVSIDGREQVTGFHIAGEPLGLDGVHFERYACDVVALEDSSVTVIPFHLLELLCQEFVAVQRHVLRLMSGEIVRETGLLLLGNMRAEQRVAAFLLNVSERLQARGYSPLAFVLKMTREEMGSYLGLTLETVSRMLGLFQRKTLVEVAGKQIRILDLNRLKAL